MPDPLAQRREAEAAILTLLRGGPTTGPQLFKDWKKSTRGWMHGFMRRLLAMGLVTQRRTGAALAIYVATPRLGHYHQPDDPTALEGLLWPQRRLGLPDGDDPEPPPDEPDAPEEDPALIEIASGTLQIAHALLGAVEALQASVDEMRQGIRALHEKIEDLRKEWQ